MVMEGPATKASASLFGLIVVSTLFVGVILGLLYYFGVVDYIEALFVWIENLGPWAPALYVLLHALVIVGLLPGIFFTWGAGFLFGVVQGSLVILGGTTIGAVCAFGVARYLFGQRTKNFLLSHPRSEAITGTVAAGGWKVIMLTRLIPFFPFKASNYLFGVMNFSLRDFVLGTFLGVIPFTVTNVYVGWLAGDLATATASDRVRTPLEWSMYGFGAIATVVLFVYIGRCAERALREYEQPEKPSTAVDSDSHPR